MSRPPPPSGGPSGHPADDEDDEPDVFADEVPESHIADEDMDLGDPHFPPPDSSDASTSNLGRGSRQTGFDRAIFGLPYKPSEDRCDSTANPLSELIEQLPSESILGKLPWASVAMLAASSPALCGSCADLLHTVVVDSDPVLTKLAPFDDYLREHNSDYVGNLLRVLTSRSGAHVPFVSILLQESRFTQLVLPWIRRTRFPFEKEYCPHWTDLLASPESVAEWEQAKRKLVSDQLWDDLDCLEIPEEQRTTGHTYIAMARIVPSEFVHAMDCMRMCLRDMQRLEELNEKTHVPISVIQTFLAIVISHGWIVKHGEGKRTQASSARTTITMVPSEY